MTFEYMLLREASQSLQLVQIEDSGRNTMPMDAYSAKALSAANWIHLLEGGVVGRMCARPVEPLLGLRQYALYNGISRA